MKQQININDADLVHRIRYGNKDAYQELFERYAPKIYQFALSYLKNEADAEGLVHDVFLKIWEKRKILDTTQNIKSFIFKIAVNIIYDFIRHKNVENAFNDFVKANYEPGSNSTWNAVILEEMLVILKELVAQLPEQCRKVYRLSREKGLSNNEIAQKLNISKRTVENHLYRATAFLKDLFKNESAIALLFFYLWCG
ncbi:MAG: RNA polymerase sigma-70 factor [Bacteroidota bacterium]